MHNDTHRLISDDRTGILYPVPVPGHRIDFRGNMWRIVGISRMPEPGKSGKVIAVTADGDQWEQELYPSVFNARIVSRAEGPMFTRDEIKARHSGHWFDADTMRFWRTRVSDRVYPTWNGTYFVTSERIGETRSRAASVRFADLAGEITTVGNFMDYRNMEAAHRAARRLMVEANSK